ncbi:MAG: glycosyltransferase [Pseudomonadota bacterium]
MPRALVSTVIPVFNRPAFLREAVASVLAQQGCELEVLIVDDGSTDDTRAAALELAEQHPDIVKVLSQANAGPGAARQAGVEKCRGEYIQFLDSDDLLERTKFAEQLAALADDPQAGIAYGKTYTRIDGIRQATPAQKSGERFRDIFPTLLTGRIWETSTPLYRRDALRRIGAWPDKRQLEDLEFDAQAGAAGIKLAYCDSFVSEYRVHAGPRLAHAWQTDPGAMRDRLHAHVAVLTHARLAGMRNDQPEMQTYARTLFWLARNAGEAGYPEEARHLLALASELCSTRAMRSLGISAYRRLASVLGWKALGRMSHAVESIRDARAGLRRIFLR